MSNPELFDYIDSFEKTLELNGLPQIDYFISKD